MTTPTQVALLVFVLPLLSGCEQPDSAAEFREQQRRLEPLYLWSIEVISPQQAGPITICTDAHLREGFTHPLPSTEGKQCALLGAPVVEGNHVRMSCTLNDHNYVVRTTMKGDPRTAFDLDYAFNSQGVSWSQTRRFRNLGPCPKSWEIGDNTDRQGNLRKNALR